MHVVSCVSVLGTVVLKEYIDRWGQICFLKHVGLKANDDPYQTKVSPRIDTFDTSYNTQRT